MLGELAVHTEPGSGTPGEGGMQTLQSPQKPPALNTSSGEAETGGGEFKFSLVYLGCSQPVWAT